MLSPLAVDVPADCREAFRRDVPAIAARSVLLVLSVSVGSQLVQTLGGSELHVAALRASPAVGLLLSIAYVRLGRERSPLGMILAAEALGCLSIACLALVGAGQARADAFALLVSLGVALTALTVPLLATVYGLVYPPLVRARLVAYGRMVGGIVAVLAAYLLGQLLAADPAKLRFAFPAAAALALAASVHFSRMPVEAARLPHGQHRRSAWAVLREDANFRRFQIFQFVLGFANLGADPVIDVFVHRRLGLTIDSAVLVVTHGVIMQAVVLLTIRPQARLFDRLGVVRHRVLTSCVIACAFVCWAYADGLGLAAVAATLGGLGIAGGQIIWMLGSLSFARREDLATYSSIHTCLTGLRGVIAPPLGVWLCGSRWLGGDYRLFFLGVAALIFLSALGHSWLVREPVRPV